MNRAFWVVVPAAGGGKRMGAGVPKQYLPLLGNPLLSHTLRNIFGWPQIAGVVVALAEGDAEFSRLPEARHPLLHTVVGGAERAHSVLVALDYLLAEALLPHDTPVLVHDAARPCVAAEDIAALMQPTVSAIALLAQPVIDTVKLAGSQEAVLVVDKTLPREKLWLAQTPQRAPLLQLHRALSDALNSGAEVTDEANALERAGFTPQIIPARHNNLKVTHPEDLILAEALLRSHVDKALSSNDYQDFYR
ncbi:MAG: 2-C-methyl-D-erythritol 4-phosphate cytidylyltransferase [Gammaproteobacteria bacterium]|nr:2-C-methyl-D-erythritol 4-phosphate cytidylyltransferase [Gammaproteobacteria bacterium]